MPEEFSFPVVSLLLREKLLGNRFYARRTYDLSLRLSLFVCALCFGAFDAPPVFHYLCLSPLSSSWLDHLCISTADPGSPPAAAAAVGCLWRIRVRTPSSAAEAKDFNYWSPRPERLDPTRPHQSWQWYKCTG